MNPSPPSVEVEALLEEISRAVRLKEGSSGVRAVLRAVYQNEPVALASLSRAVGMPVPVLAAMRRELERRGYFERRGGIALSASGREVIEALHLTALSDGFGPALDGATFETPEALAPVLRTLERHFTQRPSVDTSLDQTPCTPKTALRRALYMYQRGALDGKRVLLLGDDDAVSLAIALLGRQLSPASPLTGRLVVLEYDERWVRHLRDSAREEALSIEVLRHDLREPLPEDLRDSFDTIETDPSYTLEGLRLFLSRGLQALRPGGGRQLFLSFGAKPPDETLEVQRWLTEAGLVIQETIPNFNEYAGASMLGGRSRLLHLLNTQHAGAGTPDDAYEGPLSTGEVRPTVRTYSCLVCGKQSRVGSGQAYASIEALKHAGCSACHGTRFRLVRRQRLTG